MKIYYVVEVSTGKIVADCFGRKDAREELARLRKQFPTRTFRIETD